MIDTQLPMFWSVMICPSCTYLTDIRIHQDDKPQTENYALLLDLLAIHMIRAPTGSTIISYHAPDDHCTTSAKFLQYLVCLAGQSVYWQHIFQTSDDPTFVFLTILWYALYSWDHALAKLGEHIGQLVRWSFFSHGK